jgi:hypothetical protein
MEAMLAGWVRTHAVLWYSSIRHAIGRYRTFSTNSNPFDW